MSGAASRSELALVATGLAALTGLVLFLTDGAILFTRPFWVDEWFTVLVTSRSSAFAMLSDLASGADGGTGLFHGAIWLVRQLVGAAPVVLRAFSLLCVFGALLLVYALLRRRVGRDAAIVGILAVGSHAMVVAHSYEARFYGPWLLCAAFYAWTLGRATEPASARAKLAQALAAALLCGIHFYGVLSFVPMVIGAIASQGLGRWRSTLRALAPSVAGVVMVLAIAPLALAQKRSFTVKTWIPEFDLAQLGALLKEYWFAGVPLVLVTAVTIAWLVRRGSASEANPLAAARSILAEPGIAALAALAAVPLALALVSIAGQPSMLSRYTIVSALWWAPVTAIAIEYLGRIPGRIARLAFVWMWLVAYTGEVRSKMLFAAEVSASRNAMRIAGDSTLVLTPSVHMMYPLVAESLGGTSRLRFLALPDSMLARIFPARTSTERDGGAAYAERDLARIHSSRFAFPVVLDPASTDTLPTFMVLGSQLRLRPGFRDLNQFAADVFPEWELTLLGPELGILRRK